jgi:endo-1,3-1,4-beta-glycanase ExoK
MRAIIAASLCSLAVSVVPRTALAVKSGELYTSASHPFGRFEASIKFPAGDGVVGAFFLWKAGSEVEGTFWNELDFEKVGADCQLESNAFYGNPATVHAQRHTPAMLLCGSYHTFAFEWTPTYLAWFVDGVELRRDTGAAATAYAENAMEGMQYRFNIWPGDASFGGNFDPAVLPVYEEIDWVQYSSFANGVFTLEWRDDFNGNALDPRWLLGTWDSPKGLSQHDVRNVGVINGHAILALTSDEGVGEGVPPPPGAGGMGGAAGASGGAGLGGAGLGGAGNAGGAGLAGAGTGGTMAGGAGGADSAGASGSVTGGASGAGGLGDAGASVSGGASGASGAVSGGASGAENTGGGVSAGAGGTGNVSGSAGAGAQGSGATGGSPPAGSGASNSGPPAPSTGTSGGCVTSPGGSNGKSAWLFVLALTAVGAFRLRRSRDIRR